MKKYTKGDFSYIKFDNIEELKEFLTYAKFVLYCDENKVLYCYDYVLERTVRYDVKKAKWVSDKRKKAADFNGLEQIDEELTKEILNAIPPLDGFKEYALEEERKYLEKYHRAMEKTPRKVIGWLSDVSNYKPARDGRLHYSGAILNDIKEHNYFFVADWMPLIPVFDDGKYLDLSSRAMGWLIAISKGEADDYSYIDYAFGEPYFFEEDDFFSKPNEGLY